MNAFFPGENADFADPELIYLFLAEFLGGPAGKIIFHRFTFSFPDLFSPIRFPPGKTHSFVPIRGGPRAAAPPAQSTAAAEGPKRIADVERGAPRPTLTGDGLR